MKHTAELEEAIHDLRLEIAISRDWGPTASSLAVWADEVELVLDALAGLRPEAAREALIGAERALNWLSGVLAGKADKRTATILEDALASVRFALAAADQE